jgi:hypothetical protein
MVGESITGFLQGIKFPFPSHATTLGHWSVFLLPIEVSFYKTGHMTRKGMQKKKAAKFDIRTNLWLFSRRNLFHTLLV